MNKKLKILFCAEDFGSFEQNLYLIRTLNKKKLLDKNKSIFICNNLFKNKIEKKIISQNLFIKNIDQKKYQVIKNLIKLNKIDLVIAGLSERYQSLDYRVIKIANEEKVKSLAIQDFWGNIGNFDKKNYPKYLLVADRNAKKLTKNKINSKIIISGLPKYLKKESLLSFRKNKKKTLLIIGQPEYIPGINFYYKFLKKKIILNFHNIYYLPHPIEKKFKRFYNEKNIKIIKRENLNKVLNKNLTLINCFSTMSYDILFSVTFSKEIISCKIIFLTFRKKILSFIKKKVGSENLPLVDQKNIFQLSNIKNSDIEINKLFKKKFSKNKFIKKYFLKNHKENFFLKTLYKLLRN